MAVLAYNEVDSIQRTAELCSQTLQGLGITYELVLVDDGSKDGTHDKMRQLVAALPCCRMITHPRNLGIGAGLRSCFFGTRGQWATFFPADLQADPREIPRLMRELGDCDVLLTYRTGRSVSWRRRTVSALDRLAVRCLFGIAARDLHWVRFVRRDLLDRMQLISRSPSTDTEILVCSRRMKARIKQVELQEHPRRHGVASGASLKNVVRSLLDLAAIRLSGARVLPPGAGQPHTSAADDPYWIGQTNR